VSQSAIFFDGILENDDDDKSYFAEITRASVPEFGVSVVEELLIDSPASQAVVSIREDPNICT
jgi:hypothetical protein